MEIFKALDLASVSVMGWIIIGLTGLSLLFFWIFIFWGDSWYDEPVYSRHVNRGMKRMLVYDSPIYMYVITFFLSVLLSILAAFLMVGLFEGLLWVVCWILKILAFIIIVVAWIAIVGGVLSLFAVQIWGILVAIVGGLLLAGGRWLRDAMTDAVEWCQDLLSDVWQMSTDVAMFGYDNWKMILMIIAAPVVLVLAIAAVIIITDGVCWAIEGVVTAMYKVHRKCPYCGEEKAFDYIVDGKPHPVKLRPNMYGIFYHTNPNGKKLPTMLLNGRGKLTRQCCKCHNLITNDGPMTYGTDIHIGIVGAPAAGKSYMIYTALDELQNKYQLPLSQVDKDDDTDIEQKVRLIHAGGDIQTATAERYHAVQLMFKPSGRPVPYHLYFYDVAGEAFNQNMSEDARKKALQFYDNVMSIAFVVDPHRFDIKAAGTRFSHEFMQWMESNGGDESDRYNPNELFGRLREFIIQSGRKLKSIDFNFVLAKTDLGYLDALDTSAVAEGENPLRKVVDRDLGLSTTLITAENDFRSVNFYAVSALNGSDTVPRMIVDILKRQGVKEMSELTKF